MDIEELTFKNKIELAKFLQQENKQLKENYERIYNENCILREKHNISDIDLLDENYRLKLELSGYRQAILEDKEMLGLKQENQKYKEVIDRLQAKFNFYKNTDWGLKSCEILKIFEDIVKEVE